MKTLLFVDDHPVYREGLRRCLGEALPEVQIHVAPGLRSALAILASRRDIDFCLSDYRLADGDGVALIQEVRRRYPDIAVGVLCADPTPTVTARVKSSGAVACLSKDRDTESLAAAIDTIFNGGLIFDDASFSGNSPGTLSVRRLEILQLAGEGHPDKRIADQLDITESTVRNHWQHIFIRIGANNRTEAVTKAVRLGLI